MNSELKKNFINEDFINFSKFFNLILFNIYRIVTIFIFFISLWFLYYFTAERIYQTKSLLQIQESSVGNVQSYQDVLFGGSQNLNLEEQINLYKSRTNRIKLVDKLDLNLIVNNKSFLLPNQKDIKINKFIYKLKSDENFKEFEILIHNDSYSVSSNSEILFEKIPWGEEFMNENLTINIENPNNLIGIHTILLKSYDASIEELIENNIQVSLFTNVRNFYAQGTLLGVSYTGPNKEFNKEVINKANEIFLNQSILKNSEEAKFSLTFIDSQIEKVKLDLKESENKLNLFKKEEITIDIEAESLANIEQVKSLSETLKDLELKIVESSSFYQEGNPILERLKAQKDVLQSQLDQLNSYISSLPETQQSYIDLVRTVSINQSIFEDLLRLKLEFSLLEASTLGNVRIIDPAYTEGKVSPNFIYSFFTFLAIGGFFSFLYITINQLYFSKIKLPSEILTEFPEITLLGVINNYENIENILNLEDESLNSLITNLLLVLDSKKNKAENHKVIQIAGATSGVGKSTISYLLSKNLSERNKKVLLMDLDYKRGDLYLLTNQEKTPVDKILGDNFDIENFKIKENFYSIPRPKGKAERALSIFESLEFDTFVEKMRGIFDIVIFDTPPLLSLSESITLSRYSDIILPVIRHDESKVKDFKQLLKEFSIVNQNINYMIYNDFKKPSGYYGYDYYAYKYYGSKNYYYDKDE